MADDWIKSLVNTRKAKVDGEAVKRQAELERRRKWAAHYPGFWGSLQNTLVEAMNGYNAAVGAADTQVSSSSKAENEFTMQATKSPGIWAKFIGRPDIERLETEYSGGNGHSPSKSNFKILMNEDGLFLTAANEKALLNDEIAQHLLMPFFLRIP